MSTKPASVIKDPDVDETVSTTNDNHVVVPADIDDNYVVVPADIDDNYVVVSADINDNYVVSADKTLNNIIFICKRQNIYLLKDIIRLG
jgi:hypothetical protein